MPTSRQSADHRRAALSGLGLSIDARSIGHFHVKPRSRSAPPAMRSTDRSWQRPNHRLLPFFPRCLRWKRLAKEIAATSSPTRSMARPRPDTCNGPARRVLRALHVIVGLQIQPELMRRVEEPRQPQRRIRADAAPLAHDLVDARRSHVERVPESCAALCGRRSESPTGCR